MPIYIIKCPKCSNIQEILKSWKALQVDTIKCECGNEFVPHSNLMPTVAGVHMQGIFTNLNKLQEKNKQLRKRNS